MEYRIDQIDRRILYYLARDARNTSAPTIAEEADVTPGTIRNRIRQLEENGVLRGYHADIDYERVEGRIVNLFMCNAPVPDREQLAREVLEISGVVNVRELMTGRGNLHIVAVGTDTNDITRIAREISTRGIEIEDEALVQQEHFHPYHQFGPAERRSTPTMTDFRRLAGDAEVIDLTVAKDAAITDRTIREAAAEGLLNDEVLIVAIERGDTVITPKGDTRIEAADLVTIFSRSGVTDDILRAFTDEARQRST